MKQKEYGCWRLRLGSHISSRRGGGGKVKAIGPSRCGRYEEGSQSQKRGTLLRPPSSLSTSPPGSSPSQEETMMNLKKAIYSPRLANTGPLSRGHPPWLDVRVHMWLSSWQGGKKRAREEKSDRDSVDLIQRKRRGWEARSRLGCDPSVRVQRSADCLLESRTVSLSLFLFCIWPDLKPGLLPRWWSLAGSVSFSEALPSWEVRRRSRRRWVHFTENVFGYRRAVTALAYLAFCSAVFSV